MIYLDSKPFSNVSQTARPSLMEFASYKYGTTGKIIRTKAPTVSNERTYTINVTYQERLVLENLLADSLQPFDFIDDYGFQWLTSTGVDDSTHAYETGAYFKPPTKLNFLPQSGKEAAACDQNWNVDITILTNSTGVRGGSGNTLFDSSGDILLDNS